MAAPQKRHEFPKGNQFWKLRSKHGRDKLFASPKLLWEAACEYFDWCDNNPWMKIEQSKMPVKALKNEHGEVTGYTDQVLEIPTARPYTKEGLHLYLDVNETYLRDFKEAIAKRDDDEARDFSQVITRIEKTIYTQKFEGAAVGAFNANIIARDLGLTEKSENKNTNDYKVTLDLS